MTSKNDRDYLILELLFMKGEMSFTDFENTGIMAKSTLNDHLHSLLEKGEVRKSVGKTANHLNHLVYVITAKGKRAYSNRYKSGRVMNLKEFFPN